MSAQSTATLAVRMLREVEFMDGMFQSRTPHHAERWHRMCPTVRGGMSSLVFGSGDNDRLRIA